MNHTVKWEKFFHRGTRAIALPNWERPRLYVPAETFWQRWKGSFLCPYPKPKTYKFLYLPPKVGRLLQRVKAALGLLPARIGDARRQLLVDEFVRDALPDFQWAAISVGVPGNAQKLTLQLWDSKNQIVGYLKYGENPLACERLAREYRVLSRVSQDPIPLKFGTLGRGKALLITPVFGKHITPTQLPPSPEIVSYLYGLTVSDPVPLEAHPWVNAFRTDAEPHALQWLEALRNRRWSVVAFHGDFSPWNILQTRGGKIAAIDWEYGSPEGFPYMDLTYYLLQVAYWYLNWSPGKAMEYAVEFLSHASDAKLTVAEAEAIVRLTAYQGYRLMLEDGHLLDEPPQNWRRKVWTHELHCNGSTKSQEKAQ